MPKKMEINDFICGFSSPIYLEKAHEAPPINGVSIRITKNIVEKNYIEAFYFWSLNHCNLWIKHYFKKALNIYKKKKKKQEHQWKFNMVRPKW